MRELTRFPVGREEVGVGVMVLNQEERERAWLKFNAGKGDS